LSSHRGRSLKLAGGLQCFDRILASGIDSISMYTMLQKS
jgi:hypothetical protein